MSTQIKPEQLDAEALRYCARILRPHLPLPALIQAEDLCARIVLQYQETTRVKAERKAEELERWRDVVRRRITRRQYGRGVDALFPRRAR